jgi:hypothetical protein
MCRRQNGKYKGSQRCEVFGKLKGVCVQVRLDTEHGWQLNRRSAVEMQANLISSSPPLSMQGMQGPRWATDAEDAFGCDPTKNWNPVRYAREHAAYVGYAAAEGSTAHTGIRNSMNSYGPPKKLMQYSDLAFEIRSSADPYLEALVLTRSSTSFALSSHDALVMSIILLIVGVMMAVQPCYELCKCCKELKSDSEEFSSLVSGHSRHER